MLLWGNANYNFSEAAMGWVGNSNLDRALHVGRGWSQPNLVSYMESHDEERLMVKNILYGNSSGAYNTKDLQTALKRMELSASFLLTMPGPKMIWQFGELGYDYSINYCPNGNISDACRTDNKPIRWDYLQVPERKQLHDLYRALLQLRKNALYAEAFTTGTISRSLGAAFKWMTLNSSAGKLVVIGNFDVVAQTGAVSFPSAGTWYDYLNTGTFNATGSSQSFTLQPGEYRVFLSANVVVPVTLLKFTGSANANGNRLVWEVENEINFAHYILERSEDGATFSPVGTLSATGARSYQFLDQTAVGGGIYFYRLKQVDMDGNFRYSNTIQLSGAVSRFTVSATPNPFAGALKLSITSPVRESVTITITDLGGRKLFEQPATLQTGMQVLQIPQLAKLATGMYQVVVHSRQQRVVTRIVKTK